MQKIKQDTITMLVVEIFNKHTLEKVWESKTLENNASKAEKMTLKEYIDGFECEKPPKTSDYFARVSGVEKYRLTCKMEDFIDLCFNIGTAEKIEG